MQITSGGSVSSPIMGAWRAQMERNTFKGLDADSNGAVGLDEFKAGLQNVPAGRSGSASSAGTGRVEAAFNAVDINGDGQLSETELQSAMQARGHHHHHHRRAAPQEQSQATSTLGGLGGFLMAQLFGQDQPAAATTASTTGSGTGQGDAADLAGEVRRLLMRYVATQAATGTRTGLAAG